MRRLGRLQLALAFCLSAAAPPQPGETFTLQATAPVLPAGVSPTLLAPGQGPPDRRAPESLSVEGRIRYYMGQWYTRHTSVRASAYSQRALMDTPFLFNRSTNLANDGSACRNLADSDSRYRFLRGTCTNYEDDLADFARRSGLDRFGVLVMFGDDAVAAERDDASQPPVLCKSRALPGTPGSDRAEAFVNQSGILFKMNGRRHWEWLTMPKPEEPAWDDKRDALVWRGSTTGLVNDPNVRYAYVSALFNSHDVGFNDGVQGRAQWAEPAPVGFGRGKLPMEELLKYRYHLSLEGNDVATDLKWKLASGSLVLMPPPTKEGWLMEGRLQPWIHYVPLDSPEDVDVKLRWCRDNQPAVQAIVANATQFMHQFVDDDLERKVMLGLLKRYHENVLFEHDDGTAFNARARRS